MPTPKRKLLPDDKGLREEIPLPGDPTQDTQENKMTVYLYEKDKRLLNELQAQLRGEHGYVSRSHIIRWTLRHASFNGFEKV